MIVGMRLNPQLKVVTGLGLALTTYAAVAALKGWPAIVGHHHDDGVMFIERLCLWALLGSMLSLLLPGRPMLVCGFLIVTSLAIELSQILRPDRYPALFSAAQKILSGIVGAAIAQVVLMFLPRPP
ncbi:VanZ family protein [Bradyrhizobium sp. USDA 3650]